MAENNRAAGKTSQLLLTHVTIGGYLTPMNRTKLFSRKATLINGHPRTLRIGATDKHWVL